MQTTTIFPILCPIREKTFLEMKKDVGMTTAQKSKETRRMKWDQSLFCTSSQQSLHIRTLLHLKLPAWLWLPKLALPVDNIIFLNVHKYFDVTYFK